MQTLEKRTSQPGESGNSSRWFNGIIISVLILLLLLIPFTIGLAESKIWPDKAYINLDEGTGISVINTKLPVKEPNTIWEKAVSKMQEFFDSRFSGLEVESRAPDDWITIFEDDFEADFPGSWSVFDNYPDDSNEYFWEKKDCRPDDGVYSVWVVGGGADGSLLNCGDDYPAYTFSWMKYGPFSLADATDAEFKFDYWLNSESGFDILFSGASIDGNQFYGSTTSGVSDWSEHIVDLTDIYTLGDLTGEDQVWVAIAFQSDSTVQMSEGAYVDDVVIRKYVATSTPDTPTPTSTSTPTATSTATPTNTPVLENLAVNLPIIINNLGPTPTPTITPTPSNTPTPTNTSEAPVAMDGDWVGNGISDPDDTVYLLVVSNGTEVDTTRLGIDMEGACGLSSVNMYFYDAPVSQSGSWYRSQGDSNVSGHFTSATTAQGSYHVEADTGYCTATKDGTWEATYIP